MYVYREAVDEIQTKVGKKIFEAALRYANTYTYVVITHAHCICTCTCILHMYICAAQSFGYPNSSMQHYHRSDKRFCSDSTFKIKTLGILHVHVCVVSIVKNNSLCTLN